MRRSGASGAKQGDSLMTKNIARVVAAGSILLLAPALVLAQHPKIAPDLEGRAANSTVDVIVRFQSAPGAEQHQRILARGGRLNTDLGSMQAGAYRIAASALQDLANDPDVVYIAPDRPLRGLLDNAAAAVNADIVKSYGLTGAGIGVAVIDSGVSHDPDLYGNRVVYEESFLGDRTTSDPYGHGTHVAGIVGGTGKKSGGRYAGIAPGANLVNLRVLDQNGAGADSTVMAAIQRAIQLKSRYNIRVINLSLGRAVFESYTLDPLCQAVEAAWKAGIVVVVAAGNEGRNNSVNTHGYGTIGAPGDDPYVITVGAMKTMGTPARTDDLIASYSSKGPTAIDHIVKPDLVAPGNCVVSILDKGSTLASEFPGNTVSNFYFQLSGTSMATPMVSGAAALLLQAQPGLNPDQLKARLMKTAYKQFPVSSLATDPVTAQQYQSYYDVFTVGAGYLDIAAALANNDVAVGYALSPSAVFDETTNTVKLAPTAGLENIQAIWGSVAVWSAQVIWGEAIWGDQAVWGDQVLWGDQVIWSDAVAVGSLWGSQAPWASATTSSESTGIAINGEN